jgi:hypothetical protein
LETTSQSDKGGWLSNANREVTSEFRNAFIGTTAAVLTIVDIIIKVIWGMVGNAAIVDSATPFKLASAFDGTALYVAVVQFVISQIAITFVLHRIRTWARGASIGVQSIVIIVGAITAAWVTILNTTNLTKSLILNFHKFYYTTFYGWLPTALIITLFFLLAFEFEFYRNVSPANLRARAINLAATLLLFIATSGVFQGYYLDMLNGLQNRLIDIENRTSR